MSRLLYRLGYQAARHPWRTIGIWLIATTAVVGASSLGGRALEDTMSAPGFDSSRAATILASAGSGREGPTAQVVATPRNGDTLFKTSPAAGEALADLKRRLGALANTTAMTEQLSPDGRVALVRVQYRVLEDLGADDLHRLKAIVGSFDDNPTLQVEAGGDLFFALEDPGTGLGELVGLLVAVVVLLVAFGSVIAMGLPIGMAVLGLGLGVSAMPLVNHLIDIPSFAPTLATMIGLGVGIDYALLLVTRHREYLADGVPVVLAAARATATAGQAVVFAGGTVVVAILGLAVAGLPFVTASGLAISIVVFIMVLGAVTLLPALLGLLGPWVDRVGIHRRARAADVRPESPRRGSAARWERWAGHVGRHALGYTIGATLALLALAAPVLALRLGYPDDGSMPTSRTERRAYDLVAASFGPGTNGPLVIAVDVSRSQDRPALLDQLHRAVAADRGIASVAEPIVEGNVATVVAFSRTAPQDAATRTTIHRLRSAVIPAALTGSTARAHIGGQTATFIDQGDRVQQRLPWFIATVLALSFVLLTMVFRSVLVPLKAAVLNLLSIGGAYGVLVMVFQWEWGASFIGLEGAVPIVSFIPMFMFAVVFGLSMDYEVFLLSRVREHYQATGDNDRAVVHGLASTARVITSAALIMVSVFVGFVLGTDPVVKMLGLGLATAIFLDATVVRMILVPATMRLMGAANWWLPRWLDRILPVVDIDSGAGLETASGIEGREPVAHLPA